MGNGLANSDIVPTRHNSHHRTHSPTASTSLSSFSRRKIRVYDEHEKESRNIYKEMFRDIKKLRVADGNKEYNPHRRHQSIYMNLPPNLKKYSDTMHVVNEFWLNNIKSLDGDKLNEIAMLLYCHLYCQCSAKQRKLLLKSNKMVVPSHILKIFTIWEYFVRQTIDGNPESHKKLFKQLRILGSLHNKYLNETANDNEFYDMDEFDAADSSDDNIYILILNSFNYAMEQTFKNLYTVRIRFCFSQSYQVFIDIMNNNDLTSLLNNASLLKQIDGFLASLADCLSHEIGALYFKKYLEEQFCAENYFFHQAVQKYKLVKNNQRIKMGNHIIKTFISKRSEKEINLSSSTRNKILTIINLANRMNSNKEKYENMLSLSNNTSETTIKILEMTNKKIKNVNIEDMVYSLGFSSNLFDDAYNEIFYLMNANSWLPFRNTILGFCNNDNFSKQQQVKLLRQKNEKNEKRKLIQNVHTLAKLQKEKDHKNIKIIIARTPSIKTCTFVGNEYYKDMKDKDKDNDAVDYGDSDLELELEDDAIDEKQREKHAVLGAAQFGDALPKKGPMLITSRTSMLQLVSDTSRSFENVYHPILTRPRQPN